jgi:sugar transferase (PEP-CTERM/EpsH1 system associated)
MKILWVKAGGLVPLDVGGRIRSFHIMQELARRHALTLFTFYPEQADDRHQELRSTFAQVVCHPLEIPPTKSRADYLDYARHLFSPYPHCLAKYYRPGVAEGLRRLVESDRYDVIVCDFLTPVGVIPWDSPSPKVIFTHNVEATIWQRHYQVARNPLWKAACWREYRVMAQVERRYLERADHVLTVSDADRSAFARFLDPAKITVIPTGVDVDYFRPEPDREQPHTLVFTGAMDWLANEDAIFYFVEEILPLVRNEVPQAVLWVVGRNPSGRLRALGEKGEGVKVTGSVEDVRPYVRDAAVYIVPLRVGGGTRLKIFEALAMAKAVVSTSVGAEGLPVRPGEEILLADAPEHFAREVVRLLEDPAERSRLGQAGRRLVEREYSWPAVAERFDRVLREVVGREKIVQIHPRT